MNEGKQIERVVLLDADIKGTMYTLLGKDILGKPYRFVMNPFDMRKEDEQNEKKIDRRTKELATTLFEVFGDNDPSGQMSILLKATINTLLRHGGTSLIDLKNFMIDGSNEKYIERGKQNPNPIYRTYFETTFINNDNNLT